MTAVERVLALLGGQVEGVGEGLLRARLPGAVAAALAGEVTGRRVGARPGRSPGLPDRILLVALDPVWASRVPGVHLVAPGSRAAQALVNLAAERGRFGLFVELPPGGRLPEGARWGRWLWLRFWLSISSGDRVAGEQRVLDVIADPRRERAEAISVRPAGTAGGVADGGRLPVLPAPAGLAWVSPYELERLAPVALKAAVGAARRALRAWRERCRPRYRVERQRLEEHFARRRWEALAPWAGAVQQASSRLLYAGLAGQWGANGGPDSGDGRLQGLLQAADRHRQAALEALEAVEAERRHALMELEARMRPAARLAAAGLAVLWVLEG